MARRVLISGGSGGQVKGRLRLGWMDGVNVVLGSRRMKVEGGCQSANDWNQWRILV